MDRSTALYLGALFACNAVVIFHYRVIDKRVLIFNLQYLYSYK